MSIQRSKTILLVLFYLFVTPLSLTNCSSSDEETSVLEEEVGGLDAEGFEEEIEGLDEDVDDIDDVDEFAEDDIADELDEEFDDGNDKLADSDEDEEFDEKDEFAEFDDDELDEDDEFDEFDDEEDKKELAQNEKSLEEELNKQQYPVAQDAQPTFPEEVVADQTNNQAPVAPITSETQEIEVAEAPALPQDDLGVADPIVPTDDEEPSGQSWVPVVKIKKDPFYRNQRLMNAVYIARPSDNFNNISQKLYGNDQTQNLRADNPHLAKGIDPGDKIYYNSPNRPDDRANLKFYYEDLSLPPQFYTTQSGDNMRRLGSRLLGFPDGWKEIWAINASVDSKTILPGGLSLRYWTGNEQSPNMQVALNEPENISGSNSELPQMDEFASAGTAAEPELPPEPPLPEAQLAAPEPIADIEPFPAEGVVQTPTPVVAAVPQQNQSLLTVGAMALLLLAGVGLVAIQIKKRKDTTGINPQSLEYTQV